MENLGKLIGVPGGHHRHVKEDNGAGHGVQRGRNAAGFLGDKFEMPNELTINLTFNMGDGSIHELPADASAAGKDAQGDDSGGLPINDVFAAVRLVMLKFQQTMAASSREANLLSLNSAIDQFKAKCESFEKDAKANDEKQMADMLKAFGQVVVGGLNAAAGCIQLANAGAAYRAGQAAGANAAHDPKTLELNERGAAIKAFSQAVNGMVQGVMDLTASMKEHDQGQSKLAAEMKRAAAELLASLAQFLSADSQRFASIAQAAAEALKDNMSEQAKVNAAVQHV